MENVATADMPESLLNSSKMDMVTSCEQNIKLVSKIEMVDGQPNVHLANTDSTQLMETQFLNIQRVSDLTKNLSNESIHPELLSHHVVDLASNSEYPQHVVTNAQFYENSDFLSTNFSDDDRRLNAALVAVKFIQQSMNHSSSAESSMNAELLHGKTTLPSVSSLSAEKVISTIIPNFVQTVDTRHQGDMNLHIDNHSPAAEQRSTKGAEQHNDQMMKLYQPLLHTVGEESKIMILPPLKKDSHSLPSRDTAKYLTSNGSDSAPDELVANDAELSCIQTSTHQITDGLSNIVKAECDLKTEGNNPNADSKGIAITDDYDSEGDNDARSCQKSLPHKKRIPNKLKRALTSTPTRNIHAKCYKCTKCGEQFPNQGTFNSHKLLQHSSKKVNFSCELCNKICINQLKFFEHLKSHYEPRLLDSADSENILEIKDEYERRPRTNNNSGRIQNIRADHCSGTDVIAYAQESHPVLTCGKCGRIFRRQKAFDCHMSISHPKQEDIEEFSEPEDMMEGIRHVVNMVPGGDEDDKNFEPWHSPKTENGVIHESSMVTDTSSLNTIKNDIDASKSNAPHVKSEGDDLDDERSNKPRKQLSCPHCERTFIHRNSLLYHIRSHTGHRPHQCELCGKSFFAAGALKIHMRLHSGDKPYKCEYCGRFFRQWGDLKYHITSIHSNTKIFQCEYCGKNFARKYSLVVHRRIHTGEKNYICEYCTKTFRAASYLQNHRRIHTGEKPHMCEICGKPFRVRSDMKRHMKTHGDVSVVSVLTDLSNNTSDNNSSDVREISCLVDRAEESEDKSEECNSNAITEQEPEHSSKSVVDVSESSAPLNLNVRPQAASEELYSYSREDLVDRENTGTLYVWIQTNPDSILPDS